MYALVPFEGEVFLVRSIDNITLDVEQMKMIDEQIQSGKSLEDLQELFEEIWNQ